MGSNTNSPTPDPDEAKGAFRKPVNDAASRKYRRRSSASPSASPDYSPKQDLRSSPTSLKEEKRRKHNSRDDRVSGRGDHGSQGYRSSDHARGEKDVDNEDRNYSRVSSRSGRERGGDYNRSRDNYHYKDKYNRDRSAERSSRDKYDDRDRRGRDRDYRDDKRDYGRSSRDYRSDRITTCEESRRNQDDSKAENRSKHLNDENRKYDEGDSKGSRERFQDDAPAKRNEETAVKRTKFSYDRNDPTTGSNQGQDLLGKDTPGQAVVNMPESAGNLDAAKVAAMKAAELVNKNLVGTGVMTADQKKKLLWGNKKNTSVEESSHRWDAPIFSDRERQEKFNKLMSLRLPWYVWPIVGCEGRSEVGAEPKQRPGSNREAKRTSARSRKAIHSWTATKRWTYSRVGSLGVSSVPLLTFVTSCKKITSSCFLSTLCTS